LLCAESIQRDQEGKWSLSGIFDLLTFERFPAEAKIAVFFGVVDGRGDLPLRLRIVDVNDIFSDVEDPDAVGVVEGFIQIPDPLSPVQASVNLPVRFDHPGTYQLELWIDGFKLQTRRLAVVGSEEA